MTKSKPAEEVEYEEIYPKHSSTLPVIIKGRKHNEGINVPLVDVVALVRVTLAFVGGGEKHKIVFYDALSSVRVSFEYHPGFCTCTLTQTVRQNSINSFIVKQKIMKINKLLVLTYNFKPCCGCCFTSSRRFAVRYTNINANIDGFVHI